MSISPTVDVYQRYKCGGLLDGVERVPSTCELPKSIVYITGWSLSPRTLTCGPVAMASRWTSPGQVNRPTMPLRNRSTPRCRPRASTKMGPDTGRCLIKMRLLPGRVYSRLTTLRYRQFDPDGVHETHRADQSLDGTRNGKFPKVPIRRCGHVQAEIVEIPRHTGQ